MNKNQFTYMNADGNGYTKGFFNIYQAKSGAIMIMMGYSCTKLTEQQINELCIDVYSLQDFSHEDYLQHYNIIQLHKNKN